MSAIAKATALSDIQFDYGDVAHVGISFADELHVNVSITNSGERAGRGVV